MKGRRTNETFQQTISGTLMVAQIFGLLPVSGLFGGGGLRFNRRSFRFVYTIAISLTYLFTAVLAVYWLMSKKIEFGKIGREKVFPKKFFIIFMEKLFPVFLLTQV